MIGIFHHPEDVRALVDTEIALRTPEVLYEEHDYVAE